MNSKGHLLWSLGKSATRIVGCVLALYWNNWICLPVLLGAAELMGIAEELVDNR